MAYVASPEEQASYLRRAESAAAAAVGNGCRPEDVLAAVHRGIRDEVQMQIRRDNARAGVLPGSYEPVASALRAETPELDGWAKRVA